MADRPPPKKRKISYRDLLAEQPPAAPAPPASEEPPVEARPAAEAPVKASAEPPAKAPVKAPMPAAPPPVARIEPPNAPARPTPRSAIAIAAELRRASGDFPAIEPPPTAPPPVVAIPSTPPAPQLPAVDDTMAVLAAEALRERVRERRGGAELLLFRIGDERFAASLSAIEEAVESPAVHPLPEMRGCSLGAFELRGRLLPIYDPAPALGIQRSGIGQAALVVRGREEGIVRIGLSVDDVEDVMLVDLATVRDAPGTDDDDAILLGVVRRDGALVAIIDAEALVRACLPDQVVETV